MLSANPLLPGSRKRTKEFVASVRHLYIDIDIDGDARLAALRASDRVPAPTAIIVDIFRGDIRCFGASQALTSSTQEEMLKRLAIAFGGDPACTDRNRVLRLPGFFNQKYSPAHLVTVEYPSNRTYGPDDFRLDDIAASHRCSGYDDHARKSPPAKHSHSEDDWAWTIERASARKGRRKADAGAGFAPLRQAQSSLLRTTHRRYGFGSPLACRRRLHRRHNHHARSAAALRDSRQQFVRPVRRKLR